MMIVATTAETGNTMIITKGVMTIIGVDTIVGMMMASTQKLTRDVAIDHLKGPHLIGRLTNPHLTGNLKGNLTDLNLTDLWKNPPTDNLTDPNLKDLQINLQADPQKDTQTGTLTDLQKIRGMITEERPRKRSVAMTIVSRDV